MLVLSDPVLAELLLKDLSLEESLLFVLLLDLGHAVGLVKATQRLLPLLVLLVHHLGEGGVLLSEILIRRSELDGGYQALFGLVKLPVSSLGDSKSEESLRVVTLVLNGLLGRLNGFSWVASLHVAEGDVEEKNVEPLAPLVALVLSEAVAHLLRHVFELGKNALVKLLGVGVLFFLHELSAHISHPLKIGGDSLETLRVSASGVPANLANRELDVDVIANRVLLLLGLVDEVSARMVGSLMIEAGESDPGDFSSLHLSHHNLVMLMIADVLHHELLIHFSPLLEVHKLTVVVASFMLIVDIVCVLDHGAAALLHDELQYAVGVSFGELLISYGSES